MFSFPCQVEVSGFDQSPHGDGKAQFSRESSFLSLVMVHKPGLPPHLWVFSWRGEKSAAALKMVGACPAEKVSMPVIFTRGDKLENGHYTVIKELGVGGMGVVFHCRDELLLRDVAIKMLLPELMADKNNVEIFRQEARLAAQLEHPNVVTVYDVGVEDRHSKLHHYVAMEYLPGGNLASRVAHGALQVEHALNWMKQLAAGLSFAHKRAVVHQDIKADNIFITNEGDLKIGDFGLARLLVGRVSMKERAQVMGTPAYMSPELCRGEPQDHRSDIYSMGVLFFEMITGQLPYRAQGMIEMAMKHTTAAVPSAKRLNPMVPEILDKVIKRMMAKNADDRFKTMTEVQTILDDLIFEMRVARLGIGIRPQMKSGPVQPLSDADIAAASKGDTTSTLPKFSGSSATPPTNPAFAEAAKNAAPSQPSPTPATPKANSVTPPTSATAKANLVTPPKSAAVPPKAPPVTPPKNPAVSTHGTSKTAPSVGGKFDVPGAKISSGTLPVLESLKANLEVSWTFQSKGPIGWGSCPVMDRSEKAIYLSSSDSRVYALSSETGEVLWSFSTSGPVMASPIIVDDKLLVASTDGSVSLISRTDGKPHWQYQGESSIVATPTLCKGLVAVPTLDGHLFAIDLKTGMREWKCSVGDAIVGTPHFHAGNIYVGTHSAEVVAVSSSSGKRTWQFAADGPIVASPAGSVDSVYIGTQAGTFYSLEAESGRMVWEYSTNGPILSRGVIAFTSVMFCSLDKWIYCCEKYGGALQWKGAVRGKVQANLVTAPGSVLAVSKEGWMQCFALKSGELQWQKNLGKHVESHPLLTSKMMFLGTMEGDLVAYTFPREPAQKSA